MPDSHSTGQSSQTGLSDTLPGGKRRVAAVVGLCLLEVIRARDLPSEILAAEDPTQTMPRRLGLSEVVDRQIRRFREQVKRRERLLDDEVRDLFHLVLRRPDSEEVFLQAGQRLGERVKPMGGLGRLYPRRLRYSLARRAVRRRIRSLFGRLVGDFAHGSFTLEARGHYFLQMDPGGEACALLTGLSQTILSRFLGSPVQVSHSVCEGRKQDHCRWSVSEEGG